MQNVQISWGSNMRRLKWITRSFKFRVRVHFLSKNAHSMKESFETNMAETRSKLQRTCTHVFNPSGLVFLISKMNHAKRKSHLYFLGVLWRKKKLKWMSKCEVMFVCLSAYSISQTTDFGLLMGGLQWKSYSVFNFGWYRSSRPTLVRWIQLKPNLAGKERK